MTSVASRTYSKNRESAQKCESIWCEASKYYLELDKEFVELSAFENLCLMVEKREGWLSANIRRGSFSGGVSVPLISPSVTSTTAGLTPAEASGFFRNESIDVWRCILDFRWTAARA